MCRGKAESENTLNVISNQLVSEYILVYLLSRKDADRCMATIICDMSRRLKRNGYSVNAINLSMPRQDIGSYLGLTIETVSRTLTRLQESGLVVVEGRILKILDLDSLKQIVGEMSSHYFWIASR